MNELLEGNRKRAEWGIKISYYDGKSEDFKVVSHAYHQGGVVYSFCTADDTWHDRIVDKIKGIDYDKDFSGMMAKKIQAEQKKQP